MRKLIKRLLARWVFWRKPLLKPTEIVGAEFLEDYQKRYAEFQQRFLAYVRGNPDGNYWKEKSLYDIAVLCCTWSRTKYRKVPKQDEIIWWTYDQDGKVHQEQGWSR